IYTKGKLRHYHIIAKEGIRPETANLLINDPAGNFDPDEPDVGLLESREKDLSFLSTLKGPEQIEQDFAVRKSFNRITLPAFTQGTKKTVSPYWITVKDDNGKTFLSRVIHRSNIRGNSLTLDFPPIEGGHYHFCIKKISPVMEDILFFSKYDSYRIGAYEGTLAIDGKDGFANDLGLTVLYFSPEEPYLPSGTRLALALALVLAAGFALAALYRAERSTP
ncbi:MAG: hypothetical protein IJV04_05815, partial [Lachnospiraceae bacterium]|nr:hypothetical protein [Lachnospiraceae bacterium]